MLTSVPSVGIHSNPKRKKVDVPELWELYLSLPVSSIGLCGYWRSCFSYYTLHSTRNNFLANEALKIALVLISKTSTPSRENAGRENIRNGGS